MSNPCTPPHKAPSNYANCLHHVAGLDSNGDEAFLRKKHGLLYGPDGSVCSRWADGSDAHPIFLPEMKEQALGAKAVMVKGADGRWFALIPNDESIRQVLVSEAGSVHFADNIGYMFDSDQILEATGCGYKIAVLEDCEGKGEYRLKWLSKSDLLSCSDFPAVTETSGILTCDGEMKRLTTEATNQMLVSNSGSWGIVERGWNVHMRYITLYVGYGAQNTYEWSDLSIPVVVGGKSIYAQLEVIMRIGVGASASYAALAYNYNGGPVFQLHCLAQESDQAYFINTVPASAGSSFTIQGILSGDTDSVTAAHMEVKILNYLA